MYQALYRKWRPQTFDDVIGQKHITETLKNQVRSSRLSHAYIFIGTRVNGLCQFCKPLGLIHRVTTGEGDIGIGVGLYDAHHLIGGHGTSA